MEYIRVTKENIEQEHICCAISNNKDVQVASKKAWLLDRFEDGLVFLKSVERGKCFIEYIPAENAWNPVHAEDFMYIDCLWVSGSFKGHGYSNDLLEACIQDSREKGKKGLCILSSAADVQPPVFLECAKHPHIDEAGYTLYYTNQCPFNAKYVPIIEQTAKEHGIPFRAVHIESREAARSAPTPVTTYALFRDGKYVTNEQMNAARFLKLIAE